MKDSTISPDEIHTAFRRTIRNAPPPSQLKDALGRIKAPEKTLKLVNHYTSWYEELLRRENSHRRLDHHQIQEILKTKIDSFLVNN